MIIREIPSFSLLTLLTFGRFGVRKDSHINVFHTMVLLGVLYY